MSEGFRQLYEAHLQGIPIAKLEITMLVIFHTELGNTALLAGILDSAIAHDQQNLPFKSSRV